jgi:hypothetical protein
MERIAIDPEQPIAARIMAAKVALPFLLQRRETTERRDTAAESSVDLIGLLQARRDQLARMLESKSENAFDA